MPTVVPLVLQLELEGVADGPGGVEQLAQADSATDAGQPGPAVRAQGTVAEDAGHVRKLLRACGLLLSEGVFSFCC